MRRVCEEHTTLRKQPLQASQPLTILCNKGHQYRFEIFIFNQKYNVVYFGRSASCLNLLICYRASSESSGCLKYNVLCSNNIVCLKSCRLSAVVVFHRSLFHYACTRGGAQPALAYSHMVTTSMICRPLSTKEDH